MIATVRLSKPNTKVFAGLLATIVLLAGCGQTEQARLYTLSRIADVEMMQASDPQLSVAVGPVTLPSYLDRPQIVVRQSANRLELSEFDRWAEPLGATVPRILAANLGNLLATERVYALPQSRRRSTDLSVAVDISQFEPDAAGFASLVARWEIFAADERRPLDEGKMVAQRGAVPGDYEAMVASLSALLAELSEELANRIAAIQN